MTTEVVHSIRARRTDLEVGALFAAGGLQGRGRVTNISLSGARVERSDAEPPIGTSMVVALSTMPGRSAVKVFAEVVRRTDTGGFAVRFNAADATRRLMRLMILSRPCLTPLLEG